MPLLANKTESNTLKALISQQGSSDEWIRIAQIITVKTK